MRDAVRLQEQHHVLDRFLLCPGLADARRAHRADAQHQPQLLRVMVEHVERLQPEFFDDAPGRDRADAFDQPGAEILFDALDGGGQDLLAAFGFELLAVLGMIHPLAGQAAATRPAALPAGCRRR